MNSAASKTYVPHEEVIERQWWIVDAAGKPLGRVAVEVARLLRGKHKSIFTPYADTGDHVIVLNAAQVVMTGTGKADEKLYRHSGYPGGLKSVTRGGLRSSRPERLLERVIKGMLPHNKLGARTYRKLRVYAGDTHPHTAQKPEVRNF